MFGWFNRKMKKMSGKIGVFQLEDSMRQLLLKDSLANNHDV